MAQQRGAAAPDAREPRDRRRAEPRPPVTWSEERPESLSADDGAEQVRPDRRSEGAAASRDEPPVQAESAAEPSRSTPPVSPADELPARRRPVALWASIALILLVGAGGSWWWFHGGRERLGVVSGRTSPAAPPDTGRAGGAAASSGPKIPVEVAKARTQSLPVFFEGLGTVQAFNAVTIRSRVDGEVIQIAFVEGQTVRKGDLLARIDPRPYQAALDQAIAKKKQDEATLASTRLDLQRTQQLAKSSFASQQQLDQQTANVQAQTALLASDQAQIDNATTQLSYTTIRAPLDGRLGLRLVDQGNIVRASDQTGIVEIAQLHPISVLFTAPESQLPAIGEAEATGPVEVRALTSDSRTELGRGVLALINNTVDAASGTVRLKATFSNDDNRLWPGLSVNTRLLAKVLKDVVTVPDPAIQRGASELFVFVVGEDGKAEKRTVQVGVFSEGRAEIRDGLKDGETVVTAGQSRLTNGASVEAKGDATASRNERAADASPTKVP